MFKEITQIKISNNNKYWTLFHQKNTHCKKYKPYKKSLEIRNSKW